MTVERRKDTGLIANPAWVVLSFEGPDRYSHVGGLGTRVSGLVETLATLGYETHLFFIGDPQLPGHEVAINGRLHLHRWGQWISKHHPGGTYDGEAAKLADWNASLPSWLEREVLKPKLSAGGSVVILAEEWQTTNAVLDLRGRIERAGWADRVKLVWNANNTYGFHAIDWPNLRQAALITTVSRYMSQILQRLGVDARIIPNGIDKAWFEPAPSGAGEKLAVLAGRPIITKVARWHPDKGWESAVRAVAKLKEWGVGPLFLARGGAEPYGREVVDLAGRCGLVVQSVVCRGSTADDLARDIYAARGADMVLLENFLSREQRMSLFRASNGVLANSWFEPFGLVGLETMAVGGVAFVGSTGEDYALSGFNAICLKTRDPAEIADRFSELLAGLDLGSGLRRAARSTAHAYQWESVVGRYLLPMTGSIGSTRPVGPVVGQTPIRRKPRRTRAGSRTTFQESRRTPARDTSTEEVLAVQRQAGIRGAD